MIFKKILIILFLFFMTGLLNSLSAKKHPDYEKLPDIIKQNRRYKILSGSLGFLFISSMIFIRTKKDRKFFPGKVKSKKRFLSQNQKKFIKNKYDFPQISLRKIRHNFNNILYKLDYISVNSFKHKTCDKGCGQIIEDVKRQSADILEKLKNMEYSVFHAQSALDEVAMDLPVTFTYGTDFKNIYLYFHQHIFKSIFFYTAAAYAELTAMRSPLLHISKTQHKSPLPQIQIKEKGQTLTAFLSNELKKNTPAKEFPQSDEAIADDYFQKFFLAIAKTCLDFNFEITTRKQKNGIINISFPEGSFTPPPS